MDGLATAPSDVNQRCKSSTSAIIGWPKTTAHYRVSIDRHPRSTMTPDLSQLYAELGLHPDCTLEPFQPAYRQRLSERHPERSHGKPIAPDALPTRELHALHSSAVGIASGRGSGCQYVKGPVV